MTKLSLIASALAVLGLTACEKGLDETVDSGGSGQVKNSLLQVRTRGGGSGDDATVAYPVTVYVFAGDECRAAQTIGDEGQTLNIALVEGTYSVYAVGGASATDYVLPTADEATTTTALALREGHENSDLMAASATATLVDGGTNTITLGMTRKTMLIQSIIISKVPTTATAVSVTIAPLWQSLTVSGTYSGTAGSQTIALTKQSDNRTWLSTDGVYLLPPSSQPASVSVNITIDGVTKTYTYSTSDELEAGYKINISGTYTEAVGVNLTGTITGATWLGERTISFDFDESGSSTSTPDNTTDPDNPDNPENDIPAVGETYQGCYVLSVTDTGADVDVLLLSPDETTCLATDLNVNNALENCGAADVDDWAVPTKEQMQLVEAKLLADDAELTGEKYLYRKTAGGLGYHTLGEENTWSTANESTTYRLRPVAIVTISKE